MYYRDVYAEHVFLGTSDVVGLGSVLHKSIYIVQLFIRIIMIHAVLIFNNHGMQLSLLNGRMAAG
jgi:hypothetical protein